MPRVALYTFGVLKGTFVSEELTQFRAAAPSIFAQVAKADGYIADASSAYPELIRKSEFGQSYGPWGTYVAPRFYEGSRQPGELTMIQTLSLWRSVEAARQFTYGGFHRDALKQRGDWFEKGDWPGYVLWWVADEEVPTWGEGVAKLEALHEGGPAASGFSFAKPFDVTAG
jgi:uncharacterized protein DUF3291